MISTPCHLPISVIVLFKNHERSLTNCLSSVLNSRFEPEIILVNAGSRDGSMAIAESYESNYTNVCLLRGLYPNMAVARNQGLDRARGEYVVFVSGDDTISHESLQKLYDIARRTRAEMIRGQVINRQTSHSVGAVPQHLMNKVLCGMEGFSGLVQAFTYVPLVYGYMYLRDWLWVCHLKFDETSVHADESWVQSTFHYAEKMVFTDNDLYYLTPKDASIRYIDQDGPSYAKDMLRAGDLILETAVFYSFEESQCIYKSCLYANALRVYLLAFRAMNTIRIHSIADLPAHNMHSFRSVQNYIAPEVSEVCRIYYSNASNFEQEYLAWLHNVCDIAISNMTDQELSRKRIILIYNGPAWQHYEDTLANLPPNYVITLDRKYRDRAAAIVFYMPGLNEHLDEDLEKPEEQVWVRWNMEPESKFPWMLNEGLNELFDIRMDYHSHADVVCPYYSGFKAARIARHIDPAIKKNKICMLISSSVNQSEREEYIAELMQYIDIDSYGRLYNNSSMKGEDNGWESKQNLYSHYKFVIAFENSILEDYVTEKLYGPLLAGSVPIYMGAPNVRDYIPHTSCLVNTHDFASPAELARYIRQCYEDEDEYMKHHAWRQKPWNEDFVRKVGIQDDNPFVRLCRVLDKHR